MDRPGKETGPSYSGGIWDEEMAQSAALLTSLHFCVERMMRFTNESETPTPVRPGPFPAPAGWAISRIHLEALAISWLPPAGFRMLSAARPSSRRQPARI